MAALVSAPLSFVARRLYADAAMIAGSVLFKMLHDRDYGLYCRAASELRSGATKHFPQSAPPPDRRDRPNKIGRAEKIRDVSIFRGWRFRRSSIFHKDIDAPPGAFPESGFTADERRRRAPGDAVGVALNGKGFKMFGALTTIILIPMLVGARPPRLRRAKLAIVAIRHV